MGQPVVHFEIIGKDPEKLRSYYGFVNRNTTSDGVGIPGGVGGGRGNAGHALS